MLVVGAGPSGLSAAYHLTRLGHAVTIKDASGEPGGMMRYGIPKYRLRWSAAWMSRHPNFHVRGYKEEGTTTTPFDMVMLNDLDRFHLVMDVIDRVPGLASTAGHVRQLMVDKRISCRAFTREQGEDAPEITEWKWQY